jgi:hypothetical protein
MTAHKETPPDNYKVEARNLLLSKFCGAHSPRNQTPNIFALSRLKAHSYLKWKRNWKWKLGLLLIRYLL